jgi:hypothetical protein
MCYRHNMTENEVHHSPEKARNGVNNNEELAHTPLLHKGFRAYQSKRIRGA